MKKSVPFKKELMFNTNIAEVTSIGIDHDLKLENYNVKGNLIISGSYKMNDTSVNVEEFRFEIPVDIEMHDRYILDNLNITIDDFYYEVIDNNNLTVNVEIGLDNLEEREIEENQDLEKREVEEEAELEEVKHEIHNIDEEDRENKEEIEEIDIDFTPRDVKTLFDSFDESNETYSTYRVCIIRENDTIEGIMIKFGITRDVLELYNDLSDVKIGDKIIIPAIVSEKN